MRVQRNRMSSASLVSNVRQLASRLLVTVFLAAIVFTAQAQVTYPLNSNGSMGLGSPNGDFTVAQEDMRVKVPGGYARVVRDFDGRQWIFNRQWSGLGHPSYYRGSYASIGSYFVCDIIDGVSSCDSTASSGNTFLAAPQPIDMKIEQTRVPNDPVFGRDHEGKPLADLSILQAVARKGVGFTRSTDGTSYVSAKYPRFVVRPQSVPTLPGSAGPDAHPGTGKPGQGGIATIPVTGFRWTDRSGEWIEYDQFGRISSYGDRNDVRVWFQYGSHGQIERVLDDNGRTVFTLLYAGNGSFITEARDHTPLDGSTRRVQYQYDSKGRLHTVVDVRNHPTTFAYGSSSTDLTAPLDNSLRIVKVTDAESRPTNVTYGITGRIASITAPDGGVTELEYGYDKLKKEFSTTVKHPQTESGRKIETRHFDVEGRMVFREVNGKTLLTAQGGRQSMSYTDERGSTVTVVRDNFDEVTRKTNSDGTTTTFSYDSGSIDLKEFIDEAGIPTRLIYDDHGNLLKLQAAAGKPEEQVTEYEVNARGEAELVRRKGGANTDGTIDPDVELGLDYDASGNVIGLVDGEGKSWTYEYDAQGNLTKALNPLNHEWRYTYDANGNRISATDPNQLTSRFSYDKTDRLLTVTDAREKTYRLEYDAAGRSQKVIDPTAATLTQEYDKAGRLINSFDSMNQRMQLAYDNQDRIRSIMDGENNTTGFEYTDGVGSDIGSDLISKITYPTLQRLLRYNSRQGLTQLAEIVDGDTRTTSASYDARGAITSTTNAYLKSQATKYDAFGRPTMGTDELGHSVHLTYDHRGNLIRATDELGHATRLEYDRRDKLVKEINAVNQATTYRYDDAGRLQELLRANGAKLTFEFDAGGRLNTRKSYRPDGSLELEDGFAWDTGNRLIGWTTNNASSTSTFDDANRLLRETVTIGGVPLTRAYTYHLNGQVRTYTGPDGVTLTYTYDGNGKLSRLDIPGEGSMSVTERLWTEAKTVVLPGGTVQEIERNGLLSPTRLRVKSPSQSVVFDQQSSYGRLEELTSRTTQGRQIDYAYDDALRLMKADSAGWSGTTETFDVDAADNRVRDHVVQGTWEYDDANRLIQRGNVGYEYDQAGDLIRKTDTSLTEPRRTTSFSYDGYNRLVEVRDGADQVISRYAYDPFGYRLSKEVTAVGEANSGATAGKQLFLQAEEGLLAEVGVAGEVLQSYGWQPDQPYGTSPLFLREGTNYFYYQNDPLGMPRQLTDKAGNVVWSAGTVSAFGDVTVAPGSSFEQPWRFPGQYFDAETSLYYNVHRYYDPNTGRYISSDPAGFMGGLNRYAYGEAAPTLAIDPYGLFTSRPNTGNVFADATFGTIYALTDGADIPQWAHNASAGMANGVVSGFSLGFLDADSVGLDTSYADKCSDGYRNWGYAGTGVSLLAGAGAAGVFRGGAKGVRNFFGDPRKFKDISRGYWRPRGGANGSSLDHWWYSQAAVRSGQVSSATANAGWNLLQMPMKLNRYLGWAPNWGARHARRAEWLRRGVTASVFSAAGLAGYLGYQAGDRIGDNVSPDECGCQ